MIRNIVVAAGLTAAVFFAGCDCGGTKPPCDCAPLAEISQPGSTVLTEFHDTNPGALGVQYPVAVQTVCVPADTSLILTNSLRPGESVSGKVVIDDQASQTGHIDFSEQTFVQGINRICVRGGIAVNRTADGSTACTPKMDTVEDCVDVTVQLGVPACRFDDPADGAILSAADDASAAAGFQHDVEVVCKGINDGTEVHLLVDGAEHLAAGALSSGRVEWNDADLPEGYALLRAETVDSGGNAVAAEISITVNTGGCALRLLPASGEVFGTSDDVDVVTPGLQARLTVETDAAGTFACPAGSAVQLFVGGTEAAAGTLSGRSLELVATLPEGEATAYALSTGAKNGRSLENSYFVCSTELQAAISQPRDGLTITDAADRDTAAMGIQVAVTGTSGGVPDAGRLSLLLDGQPVMDGSEPLRPQVFFPGADFEFQYATFLDTRSYTLQVVGNNACGDEIQSAIHTVSVETVQRTCQVTRPAHLAVLLASDDKDADPANDLQYDVQISTANVPNGSTFTLYVSGQQPLTGLVIQDNLSVNEVTFSDGPHSLICELDTGETSSAVDITVDGHPPSIAFLSPPDGTSLDVNTATVELATSGVEAGQLATITVEWTDSSGPHSSQFTGTVTGDTCGVDVVLGAESGQIIQNTITAEVSDLAGNPATPASITVGVQVFTDPPVITFIDPDETQQPVSIPEGARLYTVIARVQNVATGTQVLLTVIDNGSPRAPRTSSTAGSGFVTFASVPLPRGDVVLQAAASNSAGSGTGSVTLVVGDPSLPQVVITSPADGTYTNQPDLSVTIDSNVEAGQTCRLCRRSPAGGLPPDCAAGSEMASGQADANGDVVIPVTLTEAQHELFASCDNLAGSTGTSLANLVVVDLTPPQVAFVDPADGAVYNAQSPDRSAQPGFQIRVMVAADVEDGQAPELSVNGQPAEIVGAPPEFANQSATFSAVTVADQAQHEFCARACDRAGNCSSSAPVNITVDRISPDVVITQPADLAELGSSADLSLAPGVQINVRCDFTGATAGDVAVLESNVSGTGFAQIGTHVLTAQEAAAGAYTFPQATIVPGDDTANDPLSVVLRATATDAAQNTDSGQVAVTVNRLAPEVLVTRPTDGQNFNITQDMSSEPGFQTQVNVETYHTTLGDLLVLCASPGTGYPEGHCAGHGNEVWAGTVTGVVTYLTGVNLDQGTNVLTAYAENLPGQGAYSPEVTVFVDSVPPDVQAVVVNSDANGNGCLSQAEGGLVATVTVTGADDCTPNPCQMRLMRNWPPGTQIATAPVNAGVASFSISLADGDYLLTAVVTDQLGNPNVRANPPIIEDAEAHFEVAVDAEAPSIAISSPSKTTLLYADDLNHGTEDLDFVFGVTTNAEDGQVVSFSIDAGSAGSGAVSGGAAQVTASMGQDDHQLAASVSDLCGNPASAAPLSVFVDTILPTIVCTQPADNSTFNSQDVTFVCQTTGTDSTQRIRVTSSVGGERCSYFVDGSGTTTFPCRLQEGAGQMLQVTVTDPSGNVSAPHPIANVTVDVTGCGIAFRDYSGTVRLNRSSGTVAGSNLSVNLVACSPDCTSADCPGCLVTLSVNGAPSGPAQPIDASGCTTFSGVGFAHQESGTDLDLSLDDGAGNIGTDSLFVEIVDLVAPQLVRVAPGAESVQCVAAGNPNINGSSILADKIAGLPCDMDFTFTVTDGDFDQTLYPVVLTIKEGGADIVTPVELTASPATNTFTNTQLAHNQTHALSVVATDAAGNPTELPLSVEADVVAPGVIALSAALGTAPEASRHADVDLDWTAVADDGSAGQPATAYELRWSRDAIADESAWSSASPLDINVTPASPGTAQSFQAQWLPPLNTYHLALRASDELGNLGPINADVSVGNMWRQVVYQQGVGGSFGYGVWNIGDVNNDGYEDLGVSAQSYSGNTGRFYVFYGEDDLANWANTATPQQLSRGVASEYFGWDACGKGDINGDDIPDLVVSGHGFQSRRGRVSIFFGRNGSLLPSQPDVELRAPVGLITRFGQSVEIISDINNDGIDDLFVAAPVFDANGRGFIFYGRSTEDWQAASTGNDGDAINYVPTSSANKVFLGENVDDWFGYRTGNTTLGDVNGDGYGDFALAASTIGKVYIFDGASIVALPPGDINPATAAEAVINYDGTDTTNRTAFGNEANGLYDLTGDGHNDLVTTAASFNRYYFFAWSQDAISAPYTTRITWNPGMNFGWDLDVGDINLDGYPDILIGSNASTGHKAVFYFNLGVSPYFSATPGTTLQGANYFGIALTIGYFNDDSLPDVAIGSAGSNEVYIYY